MPLSNEKQITYKAILNTEQAAASAKELAKLLRDLMTTPVKSSAGQTIDAPIQAGVKAADELSDRLNKIGRVDATASTDALRYELSLAGKDADILRDKLERLSFKGGGPQNLSGQRSAQLDDMFDRIEREFGTQAANALRASGRTFSIGDVNAEFLSKKAGQLGGTDITGLVGEATQSLFKELEEKTAQTVAERREYLQLQIELETKNLERTRLQMEMALRESDQIESAIQEARSSKQAGANEYANALADDAAAAGEEVARLSAEEADLIQEITRLNQNLTKEIAEAEAKAAAQAQKNRGEIVTAGGAGAVRTQQTAISVTKKSAENAERLTKALREAAEAQRAMEESANALGKLDSNRSRQEIAAIRERLKAQQESAKVEAEYVEQAKSAGAERIEQSKRETAAAQQAARAAAQADIESARQSTQAARASANERTEAAKAAARERIEQAKTAARREIEEEKRVTAEIRAEANRRSRAFSGIGRAIGGAALGAVGLYSLDQAIGTFYQAGKTGAQQARTAETFEYLAERAEVSSRRMLDAISAASNGTIDDMTAISLSAQLLSQKFAKSTGDITADTQLLVEYSRRAAQIYTDEQGNFLTTQEVFSRLIKFFREGNKELVDQFGLSNQAIADVMDIDVKGLASAEGATLRYKGSLELLRQELERLGPAQASTADEIEAAEARITNSLNRIKQALAPASAAMAEFSANAVEQAVAGFGGGDLDLLQRQLEVIAETLDNKFVLFNKEGVQAGADRMYEFASQVDRATQIIQAGVPGIDQYASEIERLSRNAIRYGGVSDHTIDSTNQIIAAMENAAITAGLTGEQLAALGIDISALGIYANQAIPGLYQMADALHEVSAAQTTVALTAQEVRAAQLAGRLTPGEAERRSTAQSIAETTPEDYARQYYFMQREEAQKLADQQAREQEKAAKEWAKAAEKTADEFSRQLESALRGIQGLFDPSAVTDEDIRLSELGLYQEKADEYLRRLRDEVNGGRDWDNVSVEDAAKRLGLDPSQYNPQQIVELFEKAWADSSLFAGGDNLDLINRDAVERELKRIESSKAGEQAILEYFGISTAQTGSAAVASAAGSAIMRELGNGASPDGFPATETGAGPVQFANVAVVPEAAAALAESLSAQLVFGKGNTLFWGDVQPAVGTVEAFGAALYRQAAEDTAAQSTLNALGAQLANYIGAGLIDITGGDGSGTTLMSEYVAGIRLQADTDENIVSMALGIGYQIGNYIGAGIIDPYAGQGASAGSLATAYLGELQRQFLAVDASTVAASIAGSIKAAIAMPFMDGTTTPPGMALSFLYALQAQLNNDEVPAAALAIGGQIGNYIGAGIIDPYAGQSDAAGSLATVYLGALERQFLAENATTVANSIGGNIKAAIAMAFMDDSTTPAGMAVDLLYAIRDQIDSESVAAEAQAVGSAIVGQIHAGWSAGAPDLDWITPLIRAAQSQAGAYQEEAAAQAAGAAADRYTVVLPGGF